MSQSSADQARLFRQLHQDGLLVLPNAWDAGSARLLESVGAKAIATSSAAVAWSHGYADGDLLPVPLLAATVSSIARMIRVPLSVDFEGGYSPEPEKVGEHAATLIEAGAVGINLEDGGGSPELLSAKIATIRRVAARLGVGLFVNARIDTYLRELVPADRRLAETLARAETYRAAGADGIFVPGVVDADTIRTIADAVGLPLNVLARAGLPAARELAALGVRRLSAGSGIAGAAYGHIATLAGGFLRTGESAPLLAHAMAYRDVNALMAGR